MVFCGQKILYLYDANGNKLKKQVINGTTSTKTYTPSFVYNENILEYALFDEGRLLKDANGIYEYQYFLKVVAKRKSRFIGNHLGNTRVTFSGNTGLILQQDHYYPFGMNFAGINNVAGLANQYKYNGKELQADLDLNWYDYGARFYDPTIARWNVVDPVAMAMPQWSTYTYSFNNPIRFSDPDGSIPYDKCTSNTTKIGSYGMRIHPVYKTEKMHRGTDLTAKEGTSINSFASGTVVHTGKSSSWGNYVVVDHGQGYFSLYAHIKDDGIKVEKGQKVGDGEQLAEVGSTGISTGSHLHMEVGKADDVWKFLSKKNRDETRTDAAKIGDLETFLHPEKKNEKTDEKAVKESDVKDKKGNIVGKKYENTGKNDSKWREFVNKLFENLANM